MAGINFVRRWVMGQMKKTSDDGIMITLPDKNKVDLNVNITMDRLLRNGIDPNQITSPQQVDNAINMINSRMVERAIPANSAEGREITEKLFGKQKAPVFDLEGNRISEGSGIMGGKAVKDLMESGQVSKGARGMKKNKKVQDREMFQKSNLNKTEAQLKKEMEASNKKGIANIKNKRQLTEDEIAQLDEDIGGLEYTNDFDGTVGSANKLRKERADYIREMELEYKKGNLDPEPGSGTSQRKRFLQKKYDEMEASGDNRLMTRDEVEELFDLDDIPEYAKGGRAGYVDGSLVEKQLNELRRQKGLEEDPLTSTNTTPDLSIPDLNNPDVLNQIAIDTGMPTEKQGTYGFRKDVATPDTASTIKNIQDFKRGSDRFTAPEISDFMGVDGIYKGLNPEQVQSIYDKVEKEEEDYDFSDIEGQTAGLGVISGITGALGKLLGSKKAAAVIVDRGRDKARKEFGKKIIKPQIDKAIKKIKTTGPIITGGGGGGGYTPTTTAQNVSRTSSRVDSSGNVKAYGLRDGGITRANFVGGGMGRRGFLKMLAGLGGGIAAAKTGLLKFAGKEPAKQVAKEVAGSGTPPPYFFKLVEKIKTMGDDTLATTDKAIAKKYKDYTMEEDFAGNIEIIKKGDDVAEDVYMSYKVDDVPLRGKKGSKRVEEYEEYTARPDAEGKMKDIEQGVPDEVVNEGSVFEDNMTEFGMTKKASGGIARMLGE